MPLFTRVKDPNANLDYGINWNATVDSITGQTMVPWLQAGETITTSTWTRFKADGVTPTTDITIASSSNTTTTTTVWLSGGIAGASYVITNHVTTSQGRSDDRSIKISCKER